MSSISKDDEVRVTGPSSTEQGSKGTVIEIRRGWTVPEAVIETGKFRKRTFTVPVTDLTKQ